MSYQNKTDGCCGVVQMYEPGKEYCVITPGSGANWGRTWAGTQSESVEHAKRLLTKDGQKCDEFLVVRVVARVRLAAPPIEVIEVKEK